VIHLLAYQRGERFGAVAEVYGLGRDHHPDRAGRADHAAAFSALTLSLYGRHD
jgi:hypothetical protein